MIARNYWSTTAATNGIVLLMSLGSSSIVARLLSPEGRGSLAATLFWPHFLAGVLCLSVNEGVVRVSAGPDDNERQKRAALSLALVLGILSAAAVWPLLPVLLSNRSEATAHRAQIYSLVFFPATFISMTLLALEQAQFNVSSVNVSKLFQTGVYALSVLGLWFLRVGGVVPVLLVTLGSVTMGAFQRLFASKIKLGGTTKFWRKILEVSLPLHAVNLMGFAAAHADQFVIVMIGANVDIGLYAVAVNLVTSGSGVVVQTFQTLLFAKASRGEDLAELLRKGGRSAFLLLLFCSAVGLAVVPFAVPVFFGRAFSDAVIPSLLLVVAIIPRGLRSILGYTMRGVGLTRPQLTGELIASASTITLGLVAAKAYGTAGLAVVVVFAQFAALTPLLIALTKFQIPLAAMFSITPASMRETARMVRDSLRPARV